MSTLKSASQEPQRVLRGGEKEVTDNIFRKVPMTVRLNILMNMHLL